MSKIAGDLIWGLILIGLGAFLVNDSSREQFIFVTKSYPVVMGFIKFFILATMGELLGRRITEKKWSFRNINILQRAVVWGLLGILFTYVFPVYSIGIDGLIKIGRLPSFSSEFGSLLSSAFWKSFWMNMLFAFPMMSFHRFTDTLIDNNELLSKWEFMKIWNQINWENMWGKVAPTVIWFWIPAHTITFCLPSEYRILMASALGICLGGILAFIKKRS
jgi:hypothetical protein